MFNIVPMLVFGGLFYTWKETSHIRLLKSEQFYLSYFLLNLLLIYSYYCLCIFSLPHWAYNRNWQVSVFMCVTLIFYVLNRNERK